MHSGCHCTPTIDFSSLLSMASTVPSAAVAVTRNRLPASATAWWWNELTASLSVPYIECSVLPSAMLTVWVGSLRSASCECFTVALPAMSCSTLPPRAMARACIPRQMPSMGSWRL